MLASLTNRIFLACSLLAVVSIGAAVYVVSERVTRDAEAGVQRELEQASSLVAQWRTRLSENFLLAARLVADVPNLKAAVDTADPATVKPLADRYRRQIGSDAFVVVDRSGQVLAATNASDVPPDQAVREALAGRDSVSYRAGAGGVLEIITVPIEVKPEVIGALSVGFVFDARRATEFKRTTDTEIAFAIDGRVVSGTLTPERLALLEPLLETRATSRIAIDGEDYLGQVRPLVESGGGTAAALVLQSRTGRLRFLRQINAALAGTAVVAVLAAILLSYLVARTVTRPLASITDGMKEIAATGDLTRKIDLRSGAWVDEDARLLAATFNRLTDSVGRFQREAAQKERLSSLGRFSTIIAHEIRNPLMIIKAAVRTLRRGGSNLEDVNQAAEDIGEEVDRLNRIVTQVLDFARPIRFELTDVDAGVLGASAAAAAVAGEAYPVVRVVAERDIAMTTDRERLRAVLVNLVTNARHAVLERKTEPVADSTAADIEVRVAESGADSVLFEVADSGVGIAPDVLPRVFDPYFSTRRDGSGIGLAIAKNVVEGLGGTVAIRSTVGAGTTVRIELPRHAVSAKGAV
jgi:signal transduction histidine kinase